jgi:hypothetical protein
LEKELLHKGMEMWRDEGFGVIKSKVFFSFLEGKKSYCGQGGFDVEITFNVLIRQSFINILKEFLFK